MIPESMISLAPRWLLLAVALVVGTATIVVPASAQRGTKPKPETPADSSPNLLGKYGDWEAYAGVTAGRKVCFALARPASSQTNPKNRPRDPIFLFVSSRPADNVRNEVSFVIGYSFKPNSDASAEVDGSKFTLMTQSDGAWLKNAADEARMVTAMREGSELVVKGASARGTQTTDKYSLKGLSAALDRVVRECR